jgi:hypothetical protein
MPERRCVSSAASAREAAQRVPPITHARRSQPAARKTGSARRTTAAPATSGSFRSGSGRGVLKTPAI